MVNGFRSITVMGTTCSQITDSDGSGSLSLYTNLREHGPYSQNAWLPVRALSLTWSSYLNCLCLCPHL